jgi:hypothetical protein
MIVPDEEDEDADDEDADLCSFCSALFHFAGTRIFGLHKPFQGNLPPFVPLFHIYIKTYVGQNILYNVYRLVFSLFTSLPRSVILLEHGTKATTNALTSC